MGRTKKLNGILSAFRFILGKTIVWAGVPARLEKNFDPQNINILAFPQPRMRFKESV